MPAPGLSYGLNVPKKGPPSRFPTTSKRKTIFDDDSEKEDEDNEETVESIDTLGDTPNSSSKFGLNVPSKSTASISKKAPSRAPQGSLAATHSARKHAEQAQELDPSVYDYDGVYDLLHSKPEKSSAPKGPKYMANLLAAAEVRKRDQLAAKEKMLAREREAEGEEYADKEKFVTGAYKAQQEEVRRLEEEERRKEMAEAEQRKKTGGGMTGLYKGLLAREEARHDAAMKAVEHGKISDQEEDEMKEKSEAELAKEIGAAVNDEGQVVDKRDLLKAGLNVKSKPKAPASKQIGGKIERSESMAILSGRNTSKAAMRERQTRMIEAQLEEAAKRAADDEEVEKEALQRAAKSRKTGSEISSAKERYLQRKREAEAAKAAGKEP
jgi:coiled-coil domain-containing protein 55